MIRLFEKTATNFDGNGMCVLDPTSCVVAEVAGGGYTLHLEHPMDDAGKYLMLTEERIIKAPVPPTHIPPITLPNVTEWATNKATQLYSVLPSYKRTPGDEKVKEVQRNADAYAWKSYVFYTAGNYVTQSGSVYQANYGNQGYLPGGSGAGDRWRRVCGVNDNIDSWGQDGGQYDNLASDITVVKIADYNSTYMQVRVTDPNAGSLQGKVGYIPRNDCTADETSTSGMTIGSQDITEQPFRIYAVGGEDDTNTITVEAKHISYDYKGNALYPCNVVDADPMTAIAILQGSLLDTDDRMIACDISGKTVTEDWSFYNPINALLDPDDGLVPALGARLVRNNRDFYILSNDHPRPGANITYGINMTGVRWRRNAENVITRVLPRCGDGNDGYLYLDEVYVESDISTEYAVQRTEMLDAGFDVGDKYEKADGTEVTIDTSYAKTLMREKAQERFTVDKADCEEVELEVNFILLGDTEEYRQYRGLQTVCLYDLITVDMQKSGMVATAQVTEYEWDSILGRYNSIKIGDVKSLQRKIPGYRLKRDSITYDKLGSSLISKIKGMVSIDEGT